MTLRIVLFPALIIAAAVVVGIVRRVRRKKIGRAKCSDLRRHMLSGMLTTRSGRKHGRR
jgi:hypothetical protein